MKTKIFDIFAALAFVFLLFGTTQTRGAQLPGTPPGCAGDALDIFLYTSSPDVHIGDTICYSIIVFNGNGGSSIMCDASNIQAFVVTPDGNSHVIPLATLTTAAWEGGTTHPGRTYLSNGQYDYYTNVVCYVVQATNILSDGTVRATAQDIGIILHNDTPGIFGGFQGMNTEVSLPCIQLAVQCGGSVGENGAINFTGTVTNCGNNTLVGVTVTNFVNGGQFPVTFITNLTVGQVASFSGSWVPLNPCSPSTATFVAQGVDQFTTFPRTVTSSVAALTVSYTPALATPIVVYGFVVGATLTESGCGYTNPPVIVFTGQGGAGAVGYAQISNGSVTNIVITSAGFGYPANTLIQIAPPVYPTLSIAQIFTNTPSATATPIVTNGFIVRANLTAPGSGYTIAPSVSFNDVSGHGATAYAQISNGSVTNIVITDAGSEYSSNTTINIPAAASLSLNVVIPSAKNLMLGQNYQLQITDDLNNWTSYGSVFTATNTTWTSTDFWVVATTNRMFFRLKMFE
jgi:hypothetical protein